MLPMRSTRIPILLAALLHGGPHPAGVPRLHRDRRGARRRRGCPSCRGTCRRRPPARCCRRRWSCASTTTDGNADGQGPRQLQRARQGGGTVDPATVVSDANGEVKAKWTLGPCSQVQTRQRQCPGCRAGHAAGVRHPAHRTSSWRRGTTRAAKPSAALPVQIVIRVTGEPNVPIPNQTVALAVTSGGGSISPQSAVTNALGEVTVRWTLGPDDRTADRPRSRPAPWVPSRSRRSAN